MAERFSGRTGAQGPARYEGADWETAVTGARLLTGSPAAFDCEVEDLIDKECNILVLQSKSKTGAVYSNVERVFNT